jgi:glyceraldehyde-3-phosphate dehydrogenase/erythrose-4-phosphate dehydrogenase
MSTRVAINGFGRIGRAVLRAQVKVVAWYDNEWGYANRLVELAARVLAPVPLKA